MGRLGAEDEVQLSKHGVQTVVVNVLDPLATQAQEQPLVYLMLGVRERADGSAVSQFSSPLLGSAPTLPVESSTQGVCPEPS